MTFIGWLDDVDPLGTVAAGVGLIAAAPLCTAAVVGARSIGGAAAVTTGLLSTASAISGGAAAATAANGAAVTFGKAVIAKGIHDALE